MKKRMTIMIALLTCLTLSLAGCGSGESPLYDYDLSEYVELGQYKGIEIAAPDIDVSEDEVWEVIQAMLDMAGTTDELFEGTVEDGDTANIDYSGSKDGVLFDGGTAANQELTIGSGQFIDGFEEGLIGKAIGDTVVLELTFPDPYPNNPDLAGQGVEFVVTINAVTRVTPAEYNDEFVQEHSDYDTMAELEDSVRAGLAEEKEAKAASEREALLWEIVVGNCTIIDYPKKELNASVKEFDEFYRKDAASRGILWSDFLAQTGVTQKEYDAYMLEGSQHRIGQEMIMLAIAREEGLEPSEEEYEEGKLHYLLEMEFESEEAYKEVYGETFEQREGKNTIRLAIIFDSVMALIKDSAAFAE
jgi:trigger factor